jgi:hypothetical protein
VIARVRHALAWSRNLYALARSGMLFGYWKLARTWLRTGDTWESVQHAVPFRYFGLGSKREFHWYLDGNSHVRVAGIEEIKRWLLGCVYQSDLELFNDPDFWQHPEMFESLRKGDCEDHAIWAWRKLKELQVPARLFTGRVLMPVSGGAGFHAWVVFEYEGQSWLFESVAYHVSRMVLPLEKVRTAYIPHFSVDHGLATRIYCGYAKSKRELRWSAPRAEADHFSQA